MLFRSILRFLSRNPVFDSLLSLSLLLLSGCADKSMQGIEDRVPGQETEDSLSPESGDVSAPVTFEARDLEGNTVSSQLFSETKLTMVNVWATYCNPCLREMPGLGELAGEYAAEEFRIVGIISDVMEGEEQKTLDYAADLVEQTGAAYPHLLLNKSLYDALLTDVTAVPTTFFIDENGMILDMVIGSMDKSAWEEIINGLLEK